MIQYSKVDSNTGDSYPNAVAVINRMVYQTELATAYVQIDTYISLAVFQAGGTPRYSKTFVLTPTQYNALTSGVQTAVYAALAADTADFPGAKLI